jgi:hypothetical protein
VVYTLVGHQLRFLGLGVSVRKEYELPDAVALQGKETACPQKNCLKVTSIDNQHERTQKWGYRHPELAKKR